MSAEHLRRNDARRSSSWRVNWQCWRVHRRTISVSGYRPARSRAHRGLGRHVRVVVLRRASSRRGEAGRGVHEQRRRGAAETVVPVAPPGPRSSRRAAFREEDRALSACPVVGGQGPCRCAPRREPGYRRSAPLPDPGDGGEISVDISLTGEVPPWRPSTGIGYHHNWGNAGLMKVVHDWYWARGQAGPSSVVASYITAAKRVGVRAGPYFHARP